MDMPFPRETIRLPDTSLSAPGACKRWFARGPLIFVLHQCFHSALACDVVASTFEQVHVKFVGGLNSAKSREHISHLIRRRNAAL